MAFIGWVGQKVDDAVDDVKRAADDLLGFDDSGGITGSVSEILADIDDGTREILLDETVMTIVTVALAAGGPTTAWMIPIVQGAQVAAAGGDVKQILMAAGKAYLAQQVGQKVGAAAGEAASEAAVAAEYGVSATGQQAAQLAAQEVGLGTTSALAGSTLGRAAGAATSARILGGDVEKAFIAGGISGAVPVILGNVDGFDNLAPRTQSVIESSVTGALQGAEGSDLATIAITSAVQNTQMISDMVAEATSEFGLDEDQQGYAALMATTAVSAALTGQPIPEALRAEISKQAMKGLGDKIKAGAQEGWDRLSGDYARADTAYNDYADKLNDVKSATEKRNEIYSELSRDSLGANASGIPSFRNYEIMRDNAIYYQDQYVAGNFSQEQANAKIRDFNDYAEDMQKYLDEVAKYDEEIASGQAEALTLNGAYKDALDQLSGTYEEFQIDIDPVVQTISKNVVVTMMPEFDPDTYTEINDVVLENGISAEEHWLKEGQFNNAVIKADDAEAAKLQEINRFYVETAQDKGIDVNRLYINPELTEKLMDQPLSVLKVADGLAFDKTLELLDVDASLDKYVPREAVGNEVAKIELNEGDTLENARIWWDADGKSAYRDWTKIPSIQTWSPDLGATVTTNNYGSFDASFTPDQAETFKQAGLDEFYATIVNPDGIPEYDDEGKLIITIEVPFDAPIEGADVADYISDLNPEEYLQLVADSKAAGVEVKDTTATDYLEGIAKIAEVTGVDEDLLRNTLATAYRATGGILESFNGVVAIVGANPNDTALAEFASELTNLGTALNTDDYKDTVGRIKDKIGDAEGFGATVEAIYDGFKEAPIEMLAEYVGVEAMQEIVPLLVGGGVGTAAKGLALARGAGQKYANMIGLEAGLGAAKTSDVVESFGGTAASTFQETYDLAIAQGYTEAEASQMASETAIAAGVVSSTMTLLTYGVGGDLLEKSVLGDKFADASTSTLRNALTELGTRAGKGVVITLGEGVTEGIEEGVTQLFTEGQLLRLDPDRDISGNIAAAMTLGAISGGGTTGGTYALQQTADTGRALGNIIVNTAEFDGTSGAVNTAYKTAVDNGDFTEAYKTLAQIDGLSPVLAANGVDSLYNIGGTDLPTSEFIANRATEDAIGNPTSSYVGEVGDLAFEKSLDVNAFPQVGLPDDPTATADLVIGKQVPVLTKTELRNELVNKYGVDNGIDEFLADDSIIKRALSGESLNTESKEKLLNQYIAIADTKATTKEDLDNILANAGIDINHFNNTQKQYLYNNYSGLVDPDKAITADLNGSLRGTASAIDVLQEFYVSDAELKKQLQDAGIPYREGDTDYRDEDLAQFDSLRSLIRMYDGEVAYGGYKNPFTSEGITDQDYLSQEYRDYRIERGLADYKKRNEITADTIYDMLYSPDDKNTVPHMRYTHNREAIKETIPQFMEYLGISPEVRSLDQPVTQEERDALKARIVEESFGEYDVRDLFKELENETGFSYDNISFPNWDDISVDMFTSGAFGKEAASEFIKNYADPLVVTEAEARQAYADAGINNPTDEQLQRYVGQTPWTRGSNLINAVGHQQEQLSKLAGYADPLAVTEEEAKQALIDAGVNEPTDTDVQKLVGAYDESLLTDKATTRAQIIEMRPLVEEVISGLNLESGGVDVDNIIENIAALEEAGATRDEAIAQAVEGISSTREDISGLEESLGEDISTVAESVAALEEAGATRDEAIAQIAEDLGTTSETLTEALADAISTSEEATGELISGLEESLGEDISGVADSVAGLADQIKDLQDAGIARDEAIQAVADANNIDEEVLKSIVAETVGELDLTTDVQEELDAISDLIGKPVAEVTATDVDFVADLIAQQQVLSEPMDFTAEQLSYDVTGDGLITDADLQLLNQALGGQEVTFAPESKFAQATGIYDTVQDVQTSLEQEIQRQDELDQQRQTDLDQRFEQQTDYFTDGLDTIGQEIGKALQTGEDANRRRSNMNMLQNFLMQGGLEPSRGEVKTPDPAQIRYIYDFSSIFANPTQESMFPSPYSEGGYVDEDELYKFFED